jgi:hypothetical protein
VSEREFQAVASNLLQARTALLIAAGGAMSLAHGLCFFFPFLFAVQCEDEAVHRRRVRSSQTGTRTRTTMHWVWRLPGLPRAWLPFGCCATAPR